MAHPSPPCGESRYSAPRLARAWRYALPLLLALAGSPVAAVENGTGFYLLGSKGPLAAVVPEPGVYFQNDLYLYRARNDISDPLPAGGNVGIGIKARAVIDLPTLVWSTPHRWLGGRVVLGVTLPYGRQRVSADLVAGPLAVGDSHAVTAVGDPVLTATLGWQQGRFHWSASGMVNVPIGRYHQGSMANVAFHRWGLDLSLAGTWLDPATGLDVSGVLGMTFNGRNPDTRYRSGTELHAEAAVSQYLSPRASIGVMGYLYHQVSGDSGEGAVLGAYRGRVAAAGLTASYGFQVQGRPVQARVRVLREFQNRNRVRGDAVFLTVSLPVTL